MEDGHSCFDHDADIGVAGRGPTFEEAFEAVARATFAIVTGPGGRAQDTVNFD